MVVETSVHVQQMHANFALEGLLPEATDRVLQKGYVSGELTLDDLLAYARTYAKAAALRCD